MSPAPRAADRLSWEVALLDEVVRRPRAGQHQLDPVLADLLPESLECLCEPGLAFYGDEVRAVQQHRLAAPAQLGRLRRVGTCVVRDRGEPFVYELRALSHDRARVCSGSTRLLLAQQVLAAGRRRAGIV